MKLYFNHGAYDFRDHRINPTKIPLGQIYCFFNNLHESPELYHDTDQNLSKLVQDPTFPGLGFNDDLSLDRDPKNTNIWYIYYPDPIIASPAARDSEGNFLLWAEDKIFDLLTPENSLKISQENLLAVLDSCKTIFLAKIPPRFMLIWQDDNQWIRIETFDSEITMDERVETIKKLSNESSVILNKD